MHSNRKKKMSNQKKSVLFVCLGNICRSPMAEAILKDIVSKRKDAAEWKIDSCGTGGHFAGSSPESRCIQTLRGKGISNYVHKARQLKQSDFNDFEYIFAFDSSNMEDIQDVNPKGSTANIILLRSYDPEVTSGNEKDMTVIDPYYGSGTSLFEKCFDQCHRSLHNFMNKESF